MFDSLGKILIIFGILIILLGLVFYLKIKIPFWGQLPGDILIEKNNFIFYFPLTSLILLSLIINLIAYLLRKH
jgi:hypothetical protein